MPTPPPTSAPAQTLVQQNADLALAIGAGAVVIIGAALAVIINTIVARRAAWR